MTKGQDSTPHSPDEIRGDLVRQLAEILNETDLSEIEYDTGQLRIRVARQLVHETFVVPSSSQPGHSLSPAPASDAAGGVNSQEPASHPGTIKAPMVGVVYLAAEPDSPPYIKVGDKVTEGQTLMLIEAMKTFNPVHAPKAGTISALLISDGQPIEFDQPLVTID